MPQNRTIFIHVGQHKTGSTSIQKALILNKKVLKDNNIYFFKTNPDGSEGNNSEEWIKPIRDINTNKWDKPKNNLDYGDVYKISNPKLLASKAANLPGDVVLSAESLSLINNYEKLKELRFCFNQYFNKIIIIIYLRRQDSQIISHSQEEGKGGGSLNKFGFFLNPNTAIPIHSDHYIGYLDYFERLSKWGNVFEDKNIIVDTYENEDLDKNDLVLDFFAKIGIHNIKIIPNRVNESWGFEKRKLIYLMESIKLNKYMSEIVMENIESTGKMLPSREEAKIFYSKYKKINQSLNTKFKINHNKFLFNDDFTMYPKIKNDVWDEHKANYAFKNIFDALDNMSPGQLIIVSFKLQASLIRIKIRNIKKSLKIRLLNR
jgi:hypothetical protein